MNKESIFKEMEAPVAARGCFITDVTVSSDNDVTIAIESENGVVDMDDCVAINDAFLAVFDQDAEDYSLTVTSAGLDQPFKIVTQFIKAVGSKVEVKTRDGRKLVGVLESADDNGFTFSYEVKELVPGKKKKEMVRHEESFEYGSVNSVMPYLDMNA